MDEETTVSQRLDSAEWIRSRKESLSRDGHQCVNCGAQTNLEVHHVVPLSRGGTNKPTNLVTVCRSCHAGSHEENVHDPNEETENERWLPTVNEVRELTTSTRHPLEQLVISILAKTGIGVGELCNVNLEDIFLQDAAIRDAYQLQKPSWRTVDDPSLRVQVTTTTPYSARRERAKTTVIPLDQELRCLLRRWLAVRPDEISASNPLLLSTRDSWGERISPAVVRSVIKSRAKPLGMVGDNDQSNNMTPYRLRYFFAERFSGQPRVREYLLGQRVSKPMPAAEMFDHYQEHIYSVL